MLVAVVTQNVLAGTTFVGKLARVIGFVAESDHEHVVAKSTKS